MIGEFVEAELYELSLKALLHHVPVAVSDTSRPRDRRDRRGTSHQAWDRTASRHQWPRAPHVPDWMFARLGAVAIAHVVAVVDYSSYRSPSVGMPTPSR